MCTSRHNIQQLLQHTLHCHWAVKPISKGLHQFCRYYASILWPNSLDNIANNGKVSFYQYETLRKHCFIVIYFLIFYSAQIKQQFNESTV